MTIYSGFTHEKWWFSIAMLNYQRVIHWNKNRNSKFLNTRSTRFIIKFHVNEVYEPVGENGRFHLRWRCRFVGATSLVKKRPFITTWECFFFSVIDLITVWAVEFSEYTQLWRNDTGVWFMPWFIRNLEWWMGYGWWVYDHPQVAKPKFRGNRQDPPDPPREVKLWYPETNPSKQFIETRDSNWLCLGINLWLVWKIRVWFVKVCHNSEMVSSTAKLGDRVSILSLSYNIHPR